MPESSCFGRSRSSLSHVFVPLVLGGLIHCLTHLQIMELLQNEHGLCLLQVECCMDTSVMCMGLFPLFRALVSDPAATIMLNPFSAVFCLSGGQLIVSVRPLSLM